MLPLVILLSESMSTTICHDFILALYLHFYDDKDLMVVFYDTLTHIKILLQHHRIILFSFAMQLVLLYCKNDYRNQALHVIRDCTLILSCEGRGGEHLIDQLRKDL